ncbi:DNA/RNA non-specific endonuclease [Oscillospiraceae bacterium N12]|jgi:endonuclease G|uniref:Endonuclease n=1 Tax=Jilunia laotingensis TaxID=2763675 RepID=A0A926F5P8_9BACT|nr:DNA/RNA non-specific endonuclease [Jilunia laotingensis]MBC8592384.1 DNA/RNA non-specific endonuclease [Jilunia laotingensis]
MTSIHRYYTTTVNILLLTVLTLWVGACSSNDDPDIVKVPNEAYWKTSSTVSAASGSSAIIITGTTGTVWNAEVTEGNTWCSFSNKDFTNSSQKSGEIKEGLNVLYVYYQNNTGSTQRQAKISLRFADEAELTLDLSQLSSGQQNLPSFNTWIELPAEKENANYQYVAHYAKLNNKPVRNYSLCFDKTKQAALWVAYPIHNAYLTGSGSRTDAWAFDPFIPEKFQANCVDRSYKGSYDRGHQLPSADRLATNDLNAQTFYMSNMTPQLNRLNQDMWAKLEAKVRVNKCSDTLYVVTGAYFGSNATTTFDGAGNTVAVPTNYYKVLLRTKTGSTGKAIQDCTDDELISIGFWVEQKSYGNIEPPRSICTTVADIEQKTGFTFFPKVSATVKKQNNPTQWGIN